MTNTLPALAVTGSTGFVGGAVARQLAADGISVRLIVRDLARAPQLAGTVAVEAAYSDRTAAATALEGVETLLMISASENKQRRDEHFAFVDSAKRAGVKHIAYTSFIGAAPDSTFTLGRDHWATEQRIRESGFDFTFLRDNFYADFMPMMMGEDGVIRGPAGDGRAAIVTRADVARVASAVLRQPTAHRKVTYNLTGPEALTMAEVATILGGRFYDETIDEAYESRKKWGAPGWQNDAWVSTYTAIAVGDLAAVSSDVKRVTGTPAQTLREHLAEAAASPSSAE